MRGWDGEGWWGGSGIRLVHLPGSVKLSSGWYYVCKWWSRFTALSLRLVGGGTNIYSR